MASLRVGQPAIRDLQGIQLELPFWLRSRQVRLRAALTDSEAGSDKYYLLASQPLRARLMSSKK